MTAHKHSAMIKAKADNMELVVLTNDCDGQPWYESDEMPISESEFIEYFLCLPQHKEACLHWLNGGIVQVKNEQHIEWTNLCTYSEALCWCEEVWMMNPLNEYRAKPRKEKRWIGYNQKNNNTTCARQTKAEIINEYDLCDQWQFIEIEVEL